MKDFYTWIDFKTFDGEKSYAGHASVGSPSDILVLTASGYHGTWQKNKYPKHVCLFGSSMCDIEYSCCVNIGINHVHVILKTHVVSTLEWMFRTEYFFSEGSRQLSMVCQVLACVNACFII